MIAPSTEGKRRPRVVIVGAGFGGLAAAFALRKAPVDVVVVDRRNYHLFQPLLYQVATAALSPADIAAPIRAVLRGHRNTSVLLGRVTGVDTAAREVVLDERRIPYDALVLATGARHAYFGHDEWERVAHGIKKIDDATFLRRRILMAFEQAEVEEDPDERRRLLTFAIVGGGPTGVEMAGAIAELGRMALARDFRNIDPRASRVVLIESGERVLPGFPPALSAAAKTSLEELGVEVRTETRVTACHEGGVETGFGPVEARTIVWAAGVMASPAAKWLKAEADRLGRVMVAPDLSVPGMPDVFVIGDTAHVPDATGRPLPGVAAVAKQQGDYVGRAIAERLRGRSVPPFRYRDYGAMATIGRRSAVAAIGRFRFTGEIGWLLWGVAHILFLVGFRNRIVVSLNWLWNYLTFQRGSRLITGPEAGEATPSGLSRRDGVGAAASAVPWARPNRIPSWPSRSGRFPDDRADSG